MNITNYSQFVDSLFKKDGALSPLRHAAVGISGECGELLDAFKKHVVYNKPLDMKNVIEELGDIRFYIEAAEQALGDELPEVMVDFYDFSTDFDYVESLVVWSGRFLDDASTIGDERDLMKTKGFSGVVALARAGEHLAAVKYVLSTLEARLGLTRDEIIQANIEKLSKRYPVGTYSDAAAQARLDKITEEA